MAEAWEKCVRAGVGADVGDRCWGKCGGKCGVSASATRCCTTCGRQVHQEKTAAGSEVRGVCGGRVWKVWGRWVTSVEKGWVGCCRLWRIDTLHLLALRRP